MLLANRKAFNSRVRRLRQVFKEVRDPFAVATATAQEMGHSDFSEGSAGEEKRDEIAEAIKGGKSLDPRAAMLAGTERIMKRLCS